MIEWNTFTRAHMPPEQVNVLIWRGLKDDDGGFPLIGKMYTYRETGERYICYKVGSTSPKPEGVIWEDEFRLCRWAEIERPEEAQRKWARYQARRNGVV